MYRSSVLLSTLVVAAMAVAQPPVFEPPNADTVNTFGKNFGPNLPMLIKGVSQLSSAPLRMLMEMPIQEHLEMSVEQANAIEALKSGQKSGSDVFKEITGSDNPRVVGDKTPDGLAELLKKVEPEIAKNQAFAKAGIEKILSPSQLKRFKQLYLQRSLLRRTFRKVDGTGFGWGFDHDGLYQMLEGVRDVDEEVQQKVVSMRYYGYAELLDEVFGKGTAEEKLGEPFGVLPAGDLSIQRKRPINPRR